MGAVAIHADGLNKWFGEGEARTEALKDVHLETSFGEMVYIVGPSGSGKTTLLSVLSGILRPGCRYVCCAREPIFGSSRMMSWQLSG